MAFIVYCLPRSRSYWLSRYLTYGDWTCSHDEIRHARSLEDVKSFLSMPLNGTVETAGAPFWRLVQQYAPDIRTVVIRRPVEAVVDSMARLGLQFDPTIATTTLTRLDHKLDQIEHRCPNVLSVQFDDLNTEETCRQVFQHCLPYQHDHDWWQAMAPMNLQVNMVQMLRYYQAYQPQMEKLTKIAKHTIIAEMSRNHIEVDKDDGLTIQEEPFETWYRDGKALFSEHLVLVGEAPDAYAEKNIPLMQTLSDQGMLQIITARSNGRMFGYCVCMIAPSLEYQDKMTAMHTTFYASPLFNGLGKKLQTASIEVLTKKGIDEAFFYAGVRGSGPRLGTLYKRIGAERHGEFWKLGLKD